ncbi:MAG: tRNA (adenosine(37)-N6)-threonylcarbamoyltransferase complex dimerization subunit type 1 TsaB [Verrucomicrobiota bacterium]
MILGIETSTTHASLAVVSADGSEVLRRFEFVSQRAHNSVIFDSVSEVLKEYRDHLSGIAVGLGPGSYGGVRVGISVANGLSLVLGIPVVGVSSLEAWDVPQESAVILGDARRKTFFRAVVSSGQLMSDPELLPEEEVIKSTLVSLECGESEFFTADPRVSEAIPGVVLSYPDAARVAERALVKNPGTWPEDAILEPHYLRAPYITVPKGK